MVISYLPCPNTAGRCATLFIVGPLLRTAFHRFELGRGSSGSSGARPSLPKRLRITLVALHDAELFADLRERLWLAKREQDREHKHAMPERMAKNAEEAFEEYLEDVRPGPGERDQHQHRRDDAVQHRPPNDLERMRRPLVAGTVRVEEGVRDVRARVDRNPDSEHLHDEDRAG